MTYEYVVVNDRPSAAFALDYQPFRDFSGNGIFAGGQRVRNMVDSAYINGESSGVGSVTPGNHTASTDSEYFFFGDSSIKVTANADNATGFGMGVPITHSALDTSGYYTGGLWISTNFSRRTFAYVQYLNDQGTFTKISGINSIRTESAEGAWTWIQSTFYIPSSATDVRFGFRTDPSTTAGEIAWMDGLILVEGEVLNQSDFTYDSYMEAYEENGYTIMHKPLELTGSLVSGGGAAAMVNPSSTLDINYARPTGPFSVEAWFKPVNVTERITIADGLEFDGEALYFKTEYANSGACEAVYFPPMTDRVFHLVGTHDNTSNRLWVDAIQVAEAQMTPEQISDSYLNPEVVPSGTGQGSIIVDGIALYDRVISSNVITNHYLAGTKVQDYKSLISALGGSYWTLTDQEANVSLDLDFGDWQQGIMSNVLPEAGVLRPEMSDLGVTYGGSWAYGLPLNVVGSVIDGSRIMWDGDGSFVVQTSMDNEATWQNAVNGREIEGLSGDFNTEGQSLSVRIVFTEGEPVDHITAVRRLKITLYASRDMVNSQGAQFAQPSGHVGIADGEYPVLEKNAFMGVELYDGSLTITPRNLDEADGETASVEMWVDWDGQDGVLFEAGDAYVRMVNGEWKFSGVTVYLNGSRTFGMDMANNVWTHVFVVLDTPTADAFVISGPGRVGLLATYRSKIDSSDIGTLYNNYLGIATVSMFEESVMSVTDSSTSPRIYAYNWSIISAA